MNVPMQQQGILAIFNDCRAGFEEEFEAWFQGEHLLERLAVPGFLYGRRHQAISGACGYFNFYLVASPDVLTSKPYLDRLNNPTPDDQTRDVGDIPQHEPHCVPPHAARWQFSRRLCGDGAVQRDSGHEAPYVAG
ncbi:MAG: hypothetical protein WDN48_05650 [Pseudolabrys sp.]